MTVSWLRTIPRPLIGKRGVLTSELPWNSLSYCYETYLYTFSSCKIETLYPSPVPLNNNSSFLPCFPRSWTPSFYFVPFYCLTMLDISYKWKLTVFVFFYDWLNSFGWMFNFLSEFIFYLFFNNNNVLVLPYIKMNPPQVYICSQS